MAEIFGKNPVLEALYAGKSINKILIARDIQKGFSEDVLKMAKEQRIPFQLVEKRYLDKLLPDENHQGIVALAASAEYVDWQDILAIAAKKKEMPFLLMLDGIEDPHNLGAILRTADACGVHGVIIPKRRAVALTGGVAKASAGAVEYVPVARVSNLAQTIDSLKKEGCWIVGAALKGTSIYKQDFQGPLVVVIGNEGQGLSRLIEEKCDFLVEIPMLGKIQSLNASVAAAVIMYTALRDRSNDS